MEIRILLPEEAPSNYRIPLLGVSVYYSPFGNCQVFTVAHTDCILMRHNSQHLEVFTLIAKTIRKSRMMIDVEDGYDRQIEKIFTKEQIIFKQPYESSNGSDMIMYQIDVSHLY